MKNTKSVLLSAAVVGLLMGSAATTLTSCASTAPAAANVVDKHACKTMNDCAGKGGCKTAANECAGKNACKGKGGCATVKHSCKTMNDCRGQGGCKTAANACMGKNACKGKGGCAVPKH